MKITENSLSMAFKQHSEADLMKIHSALNKVYYEFLFSENENGNFKKTNINKWKRIESAWIKHEQDRCLKSYDCYRQIKHIQTIEDALHQHPAFNHKLFDYFSKQAQLNDLKDFFKTESVLNLEFFDYLVLSIIGSSDTAKSEIITNLWEEAGKGDIQRFHTTMFKKLMNALELKYDRTDIIKKMSWEGLAGINLFSYFAFYSYNKIKYFGLLAATEMLDPLHHNKLIQGMTRVFPTEDIATYYVEQEKSDAAHASGWLEKVILPELAKKPEKTHEFWLGFYMRLNSVKRYYDKLFVSYQKY